MAVLNPNNWHWVDKNTLPWSQEYFKQRFTGFQMESPSEDGLVYTVVEVSKVDGDSNVSQRKGKPICYFDLNLEFSVRVGNKDEDDNDEENENDEGSLVLPEFMHDETEFEMKLNGFKNQRLEELVRREFLSKLKDELLKYQDDLLRTHAPDLRG